MSSQTTVSVPCAKDNTLFESPTGGLSSGIGDDLFVGRTAQGVNERRRALLAFDVAAAVPAGAIILDATLTISISRQSASPPSSVAAYRALQDWGEGTSAAGGGGGGGAPATTNDATWLHTFFPNGPWTNPGGDHAPGASFDIATPALGLASSTPGVGIVADVQSFLDQPGQNFGWLLKTDEAATGSSLRFDSRETLLGAAPVLLVTYLGNGQAASIGQGCLVNGQPFTHGWSAAPIGGTTVQLTATQGPAGMLAATVLALTFDRVGVMIGPACPAHLPLAGPLATLDVGLLDATGSRAVSLSLPPGFPGVLFTSQVAALDNSPTRFVLSNAVAALLQ